MLVALCACAQKHEPVTPQAYNYNRPDSYAPPGPPEDPWGPYIRQAARRFDVPERWIREVMRQESGGRIMATSPVGAMGLMQVMPGTYRELRRRYGFGDDPYHPYDSIMAGTAYVREMYDLYGSPAFLAAYNAGPRRLESYLWGNRGLPNETRNYVAKIGPKIVHHHPQRRVAPEIAAAAEIPLYVPAGPRRMDNDTMLALREQQRNSAAPDIQVAQLAPGTVVRMEPIPNPGSGFASTQPPLPTPAPAPVQVASLASVPPPGSVIRMDPIPDGSTGGAAPLSRAERRQQSRERSDPSLADAPPSETAALLAAVAAAQAAPAPTPAPTPVAAPVAAPVASEPEPEPQPAPVPRRAAVERAPAVRERAAPEVHSTAVASLPLPPAAPARAAEPPVSFAMLQAPRPQPAAPARGLGLIGSAQAATLKLPVPPPAPALHTQAHWAVQVGAFADRAAADKAAREAAAAAGGGAATSIIPVQQGKVTLYRARVSGLTQSSAKQACDKLRRQGACEAVAP